ncbi:MAG TPA: FtsX-like permease family protein [Nocardioides sp.]|nr:FtsX-like permease family protein [Nocardioides sp.]
MNRTLRGAWARRGTLLPLLLLTAVVVAGVVAVIGLSGGGTSSAIAVPLLALGLVAVPDTGRQLAALRRPEIAIARLRGVTSAQLAATLVVEPFLVLVLGSLLGLVCGTLVAVAAAGLWVGAGLSLDATVLPAVVLVVAVGLVAVLVGMVGALREPLADQVSIAERPRPLSTAALFGSVLLLVAAAVATYRSSVVDAQDPGWVVLAGPALVGLALGQVTVWLIRLAAVAGVRWTNGATLPVFLATRRLARTGRAAAPIRLVVAATVVAGVALTGAQQVGEWSDDTARMRAGAPYRILLQDADVADALDLSRELDPDGRWLMAAAVIPDEGSVPARRAFLDVGRYDAVVGDFLDDTPASGATARMTDLVPVDAARVATGDTVSATVRGVSRRLGGDLRPRVEVVYDGPSIVDATVRLTLDLPASGAPVSVERRLPGCSGGCIATAVVLRRSTGDVRLPYVLTGLEFGGVDLLDQSWRSTGSGGPGASPGPLEVDDGLMMLATPAVQEAVADADRRTPILATETASWDGPPLLDSPGGDDRPARVLDQLPALPLVEADGVLADLPMAAAGAPPTVPGAEVLVLAAADTPREVLEGVADAPGAQAPRALAEVEDSTRVETGATRARVYALMAGFCILVALLVLASAVSRHRSAIRSEVAALRVLGVDYDQARLSGRWEIGALGLAAVCATVVGGIAGVVLLLGNLALVDVPTHSVPLDIGVALLPIAGSAAAAAVLVVLVGGRGRSTSALQATPALLREEA